MTTGPRDMLGRGGVVDVDEAKRLFYAAFSPAAPGTERVPIEGALDRVLASGIVASETLPAFYRSAMDGYAVRAEDTFGAAESMPAYLELCGEVLMGEEATVPVNKGAALKISTGGMLPPDADAVVMLEHTRLVGEDTLEVLRPGAPGENVLSPGDDVKAGEKLLGAGHRMRPQDIGALAGIGVTSLEVYRRPRVAIINTGNEIVEASGRPAPGEVRDINSYNLAGLIERSGGAPIKMGIFRDDYGAIAGAARQAAGRADVVAITGGSSVGARDLTAGIIDRLGQPGVLVHGVSAKPGKPTIIGLAGPVPVFGLPGHPVAVTVGFELFIRPLIKLLSGEIDPLEKMGIPPARVVRARLSRSYSSAQGRLDHVRVALEQSGGGLMARPVLGRSGLITTLVRAHGTVVVPVSKQGLEKGEWVEVELFE